MSNRFTDPGLGEQEEATRESAGAATLPGCLRDAGSLSGAGVLEKVEKGGEAAKAGWGQTCLPHACGGTRSRTQLHKDPAAGTWARVPHDRWGAAWGRPRAPPGGNIPRCASGRTQRLGYKRPFRHFRVRLFPLLTPPTPSAPGRELPSKEALSPGIALLQTLG